MVSSVDALGRPCKAWILAVSWRMDGRHKLASLKPACCKPGVRSKYWLSPIFLVEWMWMAKEHWHWMIPSERIRKCGLQSENFKFVGKLLTFHRFILGLLYNSLNSGDFSALAYQGPFECSYRHGYRSTANTVGHWILSCWPWNTCSQAFLVIQWCGGDSVATRLLSFLYTSGSLEPAHKPLNQKGREKYAHLHLENWVPTRLCLGCRGNLVFLPFS